MKFATKFIAVAASVLVLTACSEAPVVTAPVTLNLSIEAPKSSSLAGTVHLYTFNAWRGEGDLRHPLAPIEEKLTYDFGDGNITHTFEYPENMGDGFAVYAFLDTDGDGALCSPANRSEFAGFVVQDEQPSGEMNIAIELDSACAGWDRFYPNP